VRKETAMGLYKGLGAVLGGIIPKMAIRFTSYESYKQMLADKETGAVTSKATFLGAFFGSQLAYASFLDRLES
jgi:solute carrier family 25 citrate transporter 1